MSCRTCSSVETTKGPNCQSKQQERNQTLRSNTVEDTCQIVPEESEDANECIDLSSLTIEQVMEMTSSDALFTECQMLTDQFSISSALIEGGSHVEEDLQLALLIYLNREEALKKCSGVVVNADYARDRFDALLKQELSAESSYKYDLEIVDEILDSCIVGLVC